MLLSDSWRLPTLGSIPRNGILGLIRNIPICVRDYYPSVHMFQLYQYWLEIASKTEDASLTRRQNLLSRFHGRQGKLGMRKRNDWTR
jgi:hypothetical protein